MATNQVETKRSRHQAAALEALEDAIGSAPSVKPHKMFGLPGFSTGGKVFACVMEDGIALKLPKERIAGLSDPAILPFEARGRRMNGWVRIRRNSAEDYHQDYGLFEESLAYVNLIAAAQ
jgi:hypothetical protein